MLCEGRGNIILFKIRFQRKNIIFKVFLQSLSESIYIFHVKDLNKISFYVKLFILTISKKTRNIKAEITKKRLKLGCKLFFI